MKNKKQKKSNPTASLIKFLLFIIFIETLLLIHFWPKKLPVHKKIATPAKVTKPLKKPTATKVAQIIPPTQQAAKAIKTQTPKEISKAPTSQPKPTKLAMIVPIKKPSKAIARVSIILDDWGYNLEDINILKEIKEPITLAILPHLPYSKNVAEFAKQNGLNIILHMPLEPHTNPDVILEKNTILTTMDDDQIRNLLKSAMETTPGIKGINNHMGSRATEDERTMKIIFSELKKHKLFFLDSVSTNNSICKDLARKMHLGFAERNVFIDNEMDYTSIKNQILSLVDLAKKQGYAIGIGHDRKLTLEVLKDILPGLSKEGIKFVALSELVKK
ncbi:MAG: divergent polysaccharide deacetylase family protein [Candidatus Omnitrophota bacterium]